METINRKYYACSVGQPGKGYDEENLKRIITNKAFILHEETTQKGFYEEIQKGDILILKYNFKFIAYGESLGKTTSNDVEWNLWAPVIDWIFFDSSDPTKGVTTYGIQNNTLEGSGQMATVKELECIFGIEKLKEINNSSVLYYTIIKEITEGKKMKKYEDIIKILDYKKQIILQGPPGTGKTYTAKDIAEKVIFNEISENKINQSKRLEESGQFELIQFHPSYSYEDFVRGINATVVNDQIKYSTINKILCEFADKAFDNLEDSNNPEIQFDFQATFVTFLNILNGKLIINPLDNDLLLTGESYIKEIDFVNSRIRYGNNPQAETLHFNQIEKLYNNFDLLLNSEFNNRQVHDTIEQNENELNIAGHVKERVSYYRPLVNKFRDYCLIQKQTIKRFILIIDEINRANLSSVLGELIYALEYRGDFVHSMYEIEGKKNIALPPNLLIIGTMNTADRSVGHIDYAIRRRFAFVDVLPNPEPIKGAGEDFFKIVSSLFIKNFLEIDWTNPIFERSDNLNPDFRPEDVLLGHSYFITKVNDENGLSEEQQIKIKMKYEVLPILKEYIKDGILNDSDQLRKIIQELHDKVA